MHSKQKGTIAEFAVALSLSKQGLPVFAEQGDLSPVDLITIVDNGPVTVQVKKGSRVMNAKGVVTVHTSKYQKEDFEVLAVYIEPIDAVCYFNWMDIKTNTCINVRYEPSVNGQQIGTRWFRDYLDIHQAITKRS
jgi:Holliday junction resolvase-like predicted endonuclease